MEFDSLRIANFIFILAKYSKLCRFDLDYSFEIFLQNEEYEKCSVLKELIDLRYFDNDRNSNYESISNIVNLINKFDDDDKDMLQYKIKLLELKNELLESIGHIEKNIIRN